MFEPIRPRPIMPSCIAVSLPGASGGHRPPSLAADWWAMPTLRDHRACLPRLPERSVAADQGVGGGVVGELRLALRLELGDDPLGEHLAELDAPLVERVDVPDHPLGED